MIRLPEVSQSGRIPSLGMAAVLRMIFDQVDILPVFEDLTRRVAVNSHDAAALHDMSLILQGLGRSEEALSVLRTALEMQRDFHIVHGSGADRHILAFVTPGDFMANTPLDFLLCGSNTTLWLRYVDADTIDLDDPPPHDVAFVAVAESETNARVLARLKHLLGGWHRPVMNNRPEMIASLTRDGVSAKFVDAPMILSPAAARMARDDLDRVARGQEPLGASTEGLDFPVVIRPIGTHAGDGMDRLASSAELASYLAAEQADRFYVSPFIAYHGPDQLYAKQRIVLIDGRPFASHQAISEHWMVHYLSAGMAENAAKREIEADWMLRFDEDFAARHAEAFRTLYERIGLDYFGIDCAELPDGRLLLFELDVAMVVHDMDGADLYPYKKPAMRKLFDAFLDAVDARKAA